MVIRKTLARLEPTSCLRLALNPRSNALVKHFISVGAVEVKSQIVASSNFSVGGITLLKSMLEGKPDPTIVTMSPPYGLRFELGVTEVTTKGTWYPVKASAIGTIPDMEGL